MTRTNGSLTAPAIDLGIWPTPLHPAERLTVALGGSPIFVKRDDLSGLGAGGSKARKLRLLLAEARADDATVVLTQGGPQSNHCAQTAMAAAMVGMRSELFLWGEDPDTRTGNLRIDDLCNADVRFVASSGPEEVDAIIAERAEALRESGEKPYVIPVGGSNVLGVAGAVSGAAEMVEQADQLPGRVRVVVAAGSLGTIAGLIIGSWMFELDWEIDGVTVFLAAAEAESRLEDLLDESRSHLCPWAERRHNYRIVADQIGPGYGQPTEGGAEAQHLAARTEGLLLDPTYTSKAMAGLIDGVRSGRFGQDGAVVFWHTGGLAGLFQ
ncbi:MAG: D-cysteine desulfhydrase family protein [Solirubrobacterales bacterium]|nr:D-cysteine desulfhydrase family protein [Solirubrobacterales bacterium]